MHLDVQNWTLLVFLLIAMTSLMFKPSNANQKVFEMFTRTTRSWIVIVQYQPSVRMTPYPSPCVCSSVPVPAAVLRSMCDWSVATQIYWHVSLPIVNSGMPLFSVMSSWLLLWCWCSAGTWLLCLHIMQLSCCFHVPLASCRKCSCQKELAYVTNRGALLMDDSN